MSRISAAASVGALLVFHAFVPSIALAAGTQPRAWVSAAHGSDAAGCGSTASPCRTFQYANANIVASGGSIFVLDPGEYGGVAITNSISIINDGVGAAVISSSASNNVAAVSINLLVGGDVVLKGLTINGEQSGFVSDAISMTSSGSLTIVNCSARGGNQGPGNGISIMPANGLARFTIADSSLSGNGATGFFVGSNASSSVQGLVRRVQMNGNANWGFYAQSYSGTVVVRIEDSVASNNTMTGILAEGAGAQVSINRVNATGNGQQDISNSLSTFTSFKTNNYGTANGTIAAVNLH